MNVFLFSNVTRGKLFSGGQGDPAGETSRNREADPAARTLARLHVFGGLVREGDSNGGRDQPKPERQRRRKPGGVQAHPPASLRGAQSQPGITSFLLLLEYD